MSLDQLIKACLPDFILFVFRITDGIEAERESWLLLIELLRASKSCWCLCLTTRRSTVWLNGGVCALVTHPGCIPCPYPVCSGISPSRSLWHCWGKNLIKTLNGCFDWRNVDFVPCRLLTPESLSGLICNLHSSSKQREQATKDMLSNIWKVCKLD